jgi:hypothetical protein
MLSIISKFLGMGRGSARILQEMMALGQGLAVKSDKITQPNLLQTNQPKQQVKRIFSSLSTPLKNEMSK